ncbi:NAD(P)-dependent oxidoreductase [Clostridium folliculivorans]|uniref:precorrin-2 dehydrogenase n=1 Tax=Clostridium folliculivorans TaxID=2886038 RepID=A0A9W5Y2R7_9CLOT|nr:NAD(P)-dependent oxidoreductase [Clostridium folliculivorans]GKU25674.1 precorrin-2 dehydrogenase [Clostridium folliculivorans]GKU28696.1 precorrin-2 dehydrogenase [Clostridium folliculivorans]
MHRDNKQDISKLEYMFLSLISSKIRVLIIGGGKAALIKATTLIKNGCSLTILAEHFDEDIEALSSTGFVELVKESYSKAYLSDKHLIFICIDDKSTIESIIEDCEDRSKLYVNCSDSKNGLAVLPMQNNNGSFSYAVNTNGGNPKMSRKLLSEMSKAVEPLLTITEFSTSLRGRMKEIGFIDKIILDFIISDEYRFFFEKGYGEKVLYLYFSKEYLDKLLEYDFVLYGGYDHEFDYSNKEK